MKLRTWSISRMTYLASLVLIESLIACSPLANVATPADRAKLQSNSVSLKLGQNLELTHTGLIGKLNLIESAEMGGRPTRIALRFWSSEEQGAPSIELQHHLRVDVRPPSGRCDGCFVTTDHILVQSDSEGPYYLLPAVIFDEAGTWTFRVVLRDPSTNRVIDEARDQIRI